MSSLGGIITELFIILFIVIVSSDAPASLELLTPCIIVKARCGILRYFAEQIHNNGTACSLIKLFAQ